MKTVYKFIIYPLFYFFHTVNFTECDMIFFFHTLCIYESISPLSETVGTTCIYRYNEQFLSCFKLIKKMFLYNGLFQYLNMV